MIEYSENGGKRGQAPFANVFRIFCLEEKIIDEWNGQGVIHDDRREI